MRCHGAISGQLGVDRTVLTAKLPGAPPNYERQAFEPMKLNLGGLTFRLQHSGMTFDWIKIFLIANVRRMRVANIIIADDPVKKCCVKELYEVNQVL